MSVFGHGMGVTRPAVGKWKYFNAAQLLQMQFTIWSVHMITFTFANASVFKMSHLDCSLKNSTKAQKVKRWQKHLAEHNSWASDQWRIAYLIFSRRHIAVRDGGSRESGSCFPPLKAVWWDTKSVSYNFPSDRIQPAEIWSNTCRNHLIGKSWKYLTL